MTNAQKAAAFLFVVVLVLVLAAYAKFLAWMDWKFCLGGLFGYSIVHIYYRLRYGHWMEYDF